MLNNVDLNSLAKIKNRQGFSLLVSDLTDFVANYEFIECEGVVCHQSSIQKFSYIFVDRLFKGSQELSICGKQMQVYITKIDIDEIGGGSVDLSHPNLSNADFNVDKTDSLIRQNDTALTYLKKPFNESFQSEELTQKLKDLNIKLAGIAEIDHPSIILNFLKQEQKHLSEVILFCQVLNLVCLSQSLYVFAYQVKANQNFARIIELVLKLNDSDITGIEHVQKLASRFFQIFMGNLTARVFSRKTLEIVEEALSTGAIK